VLVFWCDTISADVTVPLAVELVENDPMNMSAARLRWLYVHGTFWWGGLGCALIGLVLILIGFSIWRWEQGFQQHAGRAVAKVTGKEKGTMPKGKNGKETAYYLVYTFADAAGGQHEGKIRASHEDWQRAKTGDTLTVEYDSTDPATSRRAGTDTHAGWGLLILGGIGGVFAFVGIPLAAIAFVKSGRRARLVRYGTPVLGIVSAVVENDSALKVQGTYRLVYNFTDENGQPWEGRGPPQPWSLAARWDPGEKILVLYDPRNPGRNEADVFEARMEDLARLEEQMDAQ
jgi:hypothetical protein